jgi:hypothetical protein
VDHQYIIFVFFGWNKGEIKNKASDKIKAKVNQNEEGESGVRVSVNVQNMNKSKA